MLLGYLIFCFLLGYYLHSGILRSMLVEYSEHLGWFQLHTDMNPANQEENTLHSSEGSITSLTCQVFSELWHVNKCLVIFNTHKYWWLCKMNIYSPNCIYNTWINKILQLFGYKNVILQYTWKLFSYNLFPTQFVFRKWLYVTYHFIYISHFLCENNKVPLSLHFLNLKAFNTTTLNLLFVTLWAVIVRICTSKKLAVVSPTRLCTCDGE